MNLTKASRRAYQTAQDRGFWPYSSGLTDDQYLARDCQKLLLIVSEAVEAMDELRNTPSVDSPVTVDDYEASTARFEGELADIIIRTLDLAGSRYLDLETAVREKMKANEDRPMKHGKRF